MGTDAEAYEMAFLRDRVEVLEKLVEVWGKLVKSLTERIERLEAQPALSPGDLDVIEENRRY